MTDLIYSLKSKDDIKLYWKNTRIKPDIAPQMQKDRVFVPVLPLAKLIGAEVEWDTKNKAVTLSNGETTVCCYAEQDAMIVNGEVVPLDVGARLYHWSMLIPLPTICETFGYTVTWENDAVYIR